MIEGKNAAVLTVDHELEDVVEIFSRLNSRGTRVTEADIYLGVVAARNPTWVRDTFLPYLNTLEAAGFDLNPNLLFRTITAVGEGKTRFKEIPDSFWNPDRIVPAWDRAKNAWKRLIARFREFGILSNDIMPTEAALVTILSLVDRNHQLAMYLLGAPFGAVLAAYLASYKLLRGLGGLLRAIFLVTVSMGTYFVSFMLTGLLEFAVHTSPGSVSPISLFAGGFVGGFVILGTVTLLVHPATNFASLRQRIFFSAILSGALAVIGWALGPYFGIHLWSALHALGYTPPHETFQNALLGDRSRWLSLFVVWQTGTAFLLGFILPGKDN